VGVVAEVIPNEGLDIVLNIVPRNGANIATTYLFLATGLTASTVPGQTAVLATYGAAAFGEAAFTSYARQSIASASWGAPAAGSGNASGGRQSSAAQVSFPAAGASYGTAITFFGLADASGHGSEKALFYANFDDTTAISSMALGDIIKVTPTYGLLP
jgi:hypothetical protein